MQHDLNEEVLNRIGLNIEENGSTIILKRSKPGNRIDTLALLLGSLSIPVLAFATGLLIFRISNNNLSISTAFPIALILSVGGYLFSLFLKGLHRKLMFSGFSLEKNENEYKIIRRINFKLTEETFSLDSELTLNQNNKDVSLFIHENGNEHELIELKELNSDKINLAEKIVDEFNS